MALGLIGNGKTYKDLYEHIDQRYRIMYGHMDYRAGSKDDPMGLALLGHPDLEASPVRPGYEPAPVPPLHPELSNHKSGTSVTFAPALA